MYVAVLYVPILRNTIFEERSLFWRDSPYFGGTILFLEEQSLFWRDSSCLEGQSIGTVLILEGQSLFWRESPYFRGTVLIQLLCPSLRWLSSTFYGKKIY